MGFMQSLGHVASFNFLLGVFLMLASTILQNVGLGMMKLIHLTEEKKPNPASRIPYWKNYKWWITFVGFLLGVALDFASLGLLPASLALPLGGVGLAASSYFATKFCGESFTKRDKIGTFLIIVGSWSAVMFASKVDRAYTAAQLLARLSPTSSSGVYVFLVGMWIAGLIVAQKCGYNNAIFAAALPGSIGAFGNIGGKGMSELVRASSEIENQFTHPFTYVFMIVTIVTLVMQNHYLQGALARYDQVIVVPIYYVSICMFSVIGGVIFFDEWDESSQMDLTQGVLFCCGVAVIFYGVYLLTQDHLKPDSFKAKDSITSHNDSEMGGLHNAYRSVHESPADPLESIKDESFLTNVGNSPLLLAGSLPLTSLDEVVVKRHTSERVPAVTSRE